MVSIVITTAGNSINIIIYNNHACRYSFTLLTIVIIVCLGMGIIQPVCPSTWLQYIRNHTRTHPQDIRRPTLTHALRKRERERERERENERERERQRETERARERKHSDTDEHTHTHTARERERERALGNSALRRCPSEPALLFVRGYSINQFDFLH